MYKSVEVIDKRTGRTVVQGSILGVKRIRHPFFGHMELRLTLDTGFEVVLTVVEVGNRAEP